MTTFTTNEIYEQIQKANITPAKKQQFFQLLSSKSFPLDNGYLVSDGLSTFAMTYNTSFHLDFYFATEGKLDRDASGKFSTESNFNTTCRTKY